MKRSATEFNNQTAGQGVGLDTPPLTPPTWNLDRINYNIILNVDQLNLTL